jgi:hypothetical protein
MSLPILKLLGAALMLSWERRALLARVLWLPLFAGIGISLAELRWGPDSAEDGTAVFWALPIFALTVMLAVRSYRAFLVGVDETHQRQPLSWTMRETRFLFAMLWISLSFAVLAVLAGSLLGLLVSDPQTIGPRVSMLLVLVPGAWLASRLLLAFPTLAIEDASALQAFQRAWTLSREQGLRILVLCVAIPGAIAWLLGQLSGTPVAEAIATILVWLLMPFELAIVAMVYATLARPPEAPA